jgi:mobilization protein NikA
MQAPPPRAARRSLGLKVTDRDYALLQKEAEEYGFDLSTLLRLRIFGKVKGMRITRRPSADMILLGEVLGRLSAIAAEMNKNGSNLNQIAKRVNEGYRTLLGLDEALRAFERHGQELARVLDLVESAIVGCKRNSVTQEDEHETV